MANDNDIQEVMESGMWTRIRKSGPAESGRQKVVMLTKSWLKMAIGMVAALAMTGGIVFAQSGTQCKSCTDSVNSSGNLVVAYDISGLGGTTEATFTLSATLEGHARCKNNGGNCPEAANKFGPADLSTQGILGVHNGRARGTVTLTAATGLACPKGQGVVIIDVSWTNISFTVEGNTYLTDAGPLNAALVSCP
jgi:hypothetical protein